MKIKPITVITISYFLCFSFCFSKADANENVTSTIRNTAMNTTDRTKTFEEEVPLPPSFSLYAPWAKKSFEKHKKIHYRNAVNKKKRNASSPWINRVEWKRRSAWAPLQIKILNPDKSKSEATLYLADYSDTIPVGTAYFSPTIYCGVLVSNGVVTWTGSFFKKAPKESSIAFLRKGTGVIAFQTDLFGVYFFETFSEKISAPYLTPETFDSIINKVEFSIAQYDNWKDRYWRSYNELLGNGFEEAGPQLAEIRWEEVFADEGLFCFEVRNITKNRSAKLWFDIDKMEYVKKEENGNPTKEFYF